MDQKTTLTEDKLRLTAAYLNMNDQGKALLDTVTELLTMNNYQLTMEERREQMKASD